MFYCNECAKKYGYPETMFKSQGPCECCQEVKVCNDTPSRFLPSVKKEDKEA